MIEGRFEPLDRYIGANINKVQLEDVISVWCRTCVEYLSGDINNVYYMLEGNKEALKSFWDVHCPYPSSYRPALDVTNELYADFTNRFQKTIGVLRWSIEIGRIYIMTEVSCLSQILCSPREGHLNAVCEFFRYLQKNPSKNPGKIAFDPDFVPTYEQVFEGIPRELEVWNNFYSYADKSFLRNKMEPLGEPLIFRVYVDANHAGSLLKWRSQYGILIYVNNALIKFYSKIQNRVESSSFGSDFVSLRIDTEVLEALR